MKTSERLVLCLLDGCEHSGRFIREWLDEEYGFAIRETELYEMMARLEEQRLIVGFYEVIQTPRGTIKERRYRKTP